MMRFVVEDSDVRLRAPHSRLLDSLCCRRMSWFQSQNRSAGDQSLLYRQSIRILVIALALHLFDLNAIQNHQYSSLTHCCLVLLVILPHSALLRQEILLYALLLSPFGGLFRFHKLIALLWAMDVEYPISIKNAFYALYCCLPLSCDSYSKIHR